MSVAPCRSGNKNSGNRFTVPNFLKTNDLIRHHSMLSVGMLSEQKDYTGFMDCKKASVYQLLELNSHANIGIFEHILTLNSEYLAAFNAGELPLLPGQSGCAREINFDNMPSPNRRGYWNEKENAPLANVGTSAIEKPVGLG